MAQITSPLILHSSFLPLTSFGNNKKGGSCVGRVFPPNASQPQTFLKETQPITSQTSGVMIFCSPWSMIMRWFFIVSYIYIYIGSMHICTVLQCYSYMICSCIHRMWGMRIGPRSCERKWGEWSSMAMERYGTHWSWLTMSNAWGSATTFTRR